MAFSLLHYLCLATLLSHICWASTTTTTDDEEPRRSFPFRRAIDGTRGRKFYDPEDDGFLHSYGSSGRYDPDHQVNDFSDIRNNVPGEPGIDYPSYTRLPQTGFVCEAEFRGYYADEAAGCQVFHVCDGNFLVSSFLCPMGSIFSQKLLTCDWWTKVDCSATRNYHIINSESLVSEADDDDILRKAFEMSSVQSAGERIPIETVNQQTESEHQERRNRVLNYGSSTVTERINDLQTGKDKDSDYPNYSSRVESRLQSRTGQKNRQRYQDDDYYNEDVDEDNKSRNNPSIRVHNIGEDRRNDRTFRNEFQPSYAPTVPTVITTTRRFYSPTFPTTYRPSIEREGRARFDLEFESSDHLYTARGRTSDETLKAVTLPSVTSKIITSTEDNSLAILVNSADERNDDVEKMQESESSYYRTNVTIPDVQINVTKDENSSEAVVSKERKDGKNIVETFSILTIDNENRNPDIFAYNRDEEIVAKNVTNFENSGSSESDKKSGKIAAFLQPPKEVNQFRITVLDDSSISKSYKEAPENHSYSNVEIIRSIEVPAAGITPPLIDEKEATRESRVIRIFLNKNNNTSSEILSSNHPESSTEKIAKEDFNSLIEDSQGEHTETRIISEVLPKEQEEIKNISEKEISTKVSADNSSLNSKFENSQSIGVITAAVTLEEYVLNATTETTNEASSIIPEEEKTSEDERKLDEILIKSNTTVVEDKNDEDYKKLSGSDATFNTNTTDYATEKSDEKLSDIKELLINANATVTEEKKNEQPSGIEELSLDAKTTDAEEKNKPDFKEPKEINLNDSKASVSEEKNYGSVEKSNDDREIKIWQEKNIEHSVGSEAILLDAKTNDTNEKITGDQGHSIENEEILVNTKTDVSVEKSIEHSIDSETILSDSKPIVSSDKIPENHEHSIGAEETLLNAKMGDFQGKDSDNHERSSRSDEITPIEDKIEDTVVEGSSPFQVTVTVNKDDEFDPNGDIIRQLIAKHEIGDDSVAAAHYTRFDIVKSETSKDTIEDTINTAGSRNFRRIELEREINDERLENIQSNKLPMNYYRNLVALVNGPNAPRPFSLESPQNGQIRISSNIDDTGSSTTIPLISENFKNDLTPASSRIPVQANRQPLTSSLQDSESLEKFTTSAKDELTNSEKILEQLSQTFGERQPKANKEKLIFDLPQEQRSFNFKTGLPLDVSQQTNTRIDEESEELRTTQRSNEKSLPKTVVETEFIPSISFSLNTDQEREEYMDAVVKGLLSDVRASETMNNNNTNVSVES